MYEIPFADPDTEHLDLLVRTWDDLLDQRKRFVNRAVDWCAVNERVGAEQAASLVQATLDAMVKGAKPYDVGLVKTDLRSPEVLEYALALLVSERAVKARLERAVKRHPMADWLVEAKTAGARAAIILTTIRHPQRFPGQMCSDGHHTLPVFDAGEPCPVESIEKKGDDPQPCAGVMLAPRPHTGVRSLWHMCGMYPIAAKDGTMRLARLVDGAQASHRPAAKTALLMPHGIADQFKLQKSRYDEPYREAKERLAVERPDWKPMRIEQTAKVIAAKAWLGDLLTEWKRRVPLDAEQAGEVEGGSGASAHAA